MNFVILKLFNFYNSHLKIKLSNKTMLFLHFGSAVNVC